MSTTTISHPATATASSRSISSGGSSADEIVKPDNDSPVLDRWESRFFGGVIAGMVVTVAATALVGLSTWTKADFGVSNVVLSYVGFGGVICSTLLLCVLVCYKKKLKDAFAEPPQTEQTASDLV